MKRCLRRQCSPSLSIRAAGLFLLLLLAALGHAQVPQATPNADLWDNGAVYVIHPDGNGGFYIGGGFSHVQGTPRSNLAHIQADGTVNPAFAPTLNGGVYTIQTTVDGTVLIGGGFTTVNGVGRNYAAKLSANGVLDAAWNPNANSAVQRMRIDTAGRVYLAGDFTGVGGQARGRLARTAITGTGAPDADWQPNANGTALALAPTTDGKVWVAGNFTSINGQTAGLARLSSTGVIEISSTSGARDLELDPSGRLYVCSPNNASRRLANGNPDTGWQVMTNDFITDCELDGDSLLLSGRFTTVGGQPRHGTARVGTAAGAPVDSAWTVRATGNFIGYPGHEIWAISRVNSGQIAVGGELRHIGDQPRAGLALLAPANGSVLPALNVERTATVNTAITFSDGSRILGGIFWRAGAHVRQNLLRLTSAGVVDPAWDLPVNGRILAGVGQWSSHEVWLGGYFTEAAGQPRQMLFKIGNASVAALDGTWVPAANGAVTVFHREQSSGRIYTGGVFTSIGGVARNRVARLPGSGTGAPDSWHPNINGQVNAIAQPFGFDIWIGGYFTGAGGVARNNLAVFDTGPTATLSGINPGPNGTVWSLFTRFDVPTDIYVGGDFTTIGGQARARVASFSVGTLSAWNPGANAAPRVMRLDAEDNLYVAGGFTQFGGVERLGVARVTGSGPAVVDPSYAPRMNGSVADMSLGSDGVLVAGSFSQVGSHSRRGVAVLSTEGLPDTIFANGFQSVPTSMQDMAEWGSAPACLRAPMALQARTAEMPGPEPACSPADRW